MNQPLMLAVISLTATLLLPAAALAQTYKWRDASGSIVFSDQPPPPGTPAANILQAPRAKPAATPVVGVPDGATAPAAGKPAAAPAGPTSTAEREVDYKKRQITAQKKAKEDADKATLEQQRQTACTSLRDNLATLESGMRVARTDAKGERFFIDDAQRATDIAKARQEMAAAKC